MKLHTVLFAATSALLRLGLIAPLSPSTAFVTPSRPATAATAATAATTTALNAAAAVANRNNPFKRLPWNVRKEKEREARRFQQERVALHRQLGIAEDASYEEIVRATDSLIQKAGSDIKQKVKIEVAKDKILQIRLNERLAGLARANTEARAMSSYEVDG
jgi:hypothetical protein